MGNTPRPASRGGISFWGALILLVIAAKLFGFLQVSWLWVLCPIWIPAALFVLLCTGVGFCGIMVEYTKKL